MQSSPPAETFAAPPRVSRLAIAALALVAVCPIVYVIESVFGGSTPIELATIGLTGLILAHVAYVRIKRRKGVLGGLGYCRAAMVLGYAAMVLSAIMYALFWFVTSRPLQ